MDAVLLVDGYGDRVICDGSELAEQMASIDATELQELDLLASFDHGLRTGDETSAVVGCECAYRVGGTLLTLFGLDLRRVDVWSAMCDALDLGTWSGGWSDEPPAAAEYLWEWSDDMAMMANNVGLIVETNSDCGMTWVYVPMGDVETIETPELPDNAYAVSICTDCAMWHANGDLSGLDAHGGSGEEVAYAAARYEEVTRADIGGHVAVGNSEAYFSWSRCDLCGMRLGGDRLDAVLFAFDPETTTETTNA